VRRGIVILILVSGLLVSGLAILLTGDISTLSPGESSALTLLFLAGVGGVIGLISTRMSIARLRGQIKTAADGSLSRVDRSHPDLAKLADAVNEVIDVAEHAVGRAQLHVKELEIQLKVATAERQHAEAIIYSISDAVLVTDPFDELVLANESAARTFDFNLEQSSRLPMESVLRDPKMIELIRDMRQSKSRSGRRIVEHQVRTPVGERVFKVTLSCVADPVARDDRPLLDRGEHNAGVVAVLHDMTREREVAEMKNDFVSSVSHELRTPLASIKAYVEMLIDGEADNDRIRREFYDVIQNEANRLSRLIDNILNISRIESGLVKVNKQPQSLAVILKEAIEVISPQARNKQIEVIDRLTPVFYQTIADKDMLYQAVLNLLSNAVKYTAEKGTVTV
jgi:two-component system, OmpR family, phosphate regulon sensor histidine kinase PhoR